MVTKTKEAKKPPPKKTPVKRKTRSRALTVKQELPKEMTEARALDDYIKRQKQLMQFVKKNLNELVDYGPMYEKDEKKNIWISGCEKVKNWLKLKNEPFIDRESAEMIGAEKTVCYTMYLIKLSDVPLLHKLIIDMGVANEEKAYRMISISTGKGGATVNGTTVKDANVAVKKARMRSFKDAILNLGLHNEFTQDMDEEMENMEPGEVKEKDATKRRALSITKLYDQGIALLRQQIYDSQKTAYQMEQKLVKMYEHKNYEAVKALKEAFERQKKLKAKEANHANPNQGNRSG